MEVNTNPLFSIEGKREFGFFSRSSCIDEMNKSDYKKVSELHLTLHSKPPSFNVLTDRIYSNLKSLSFSSELLDSSSLTSETILIDLQKICSTTSLNSIKRIYLYNHHYPNDFRKKKYLSIRIE